MQSNHPFILLAALGIAVGTTLVSADPPKPREDAEPSEIATPDSVDLSRRSFLHERRTSPELRRLETENPEQITDIISGSVREAPDLGISEVTSQTTFECGTAAYDSGVSHTAFLFCSGDGHAYDPDYMFAVRFDLADFGYLPGEAEITGFCAANQLAFEGGPWQNEVFIYPDSNGVPDDSVVLGRGTIQTGDGLGPSEVFLPAPVILDTNFWLINRGDPSHEGQEFNMEVDKGPNSGHSYDSATGIEGLELDGDGNYALRATLQRNALYCSYSVEPKEAELGPLGGESTFTVSTEHECSWSARSNDPWITIASGSSYQGTSDVVIAVARNAGAQRTGSITVAGFVIEVTQSVSSQSTQNYVIPAAVRLSGAHDTYWNSDFRFFNPCGEPIDIRVSFEPEGVNNTNTELVSTAFQLDAEETRVYPDITAVFPSFEGLEITGSLLIESDGISGCTVLPSSRTFNLTTEGTLGLSVPAAQVTTAGQPILHLTGLISNDRYRTNLRLVNFGDDDDWVKLKVIDRDGNILTDGKNALVRGHSTRQISNVAGWIGAPGDLSLFSLQVDTSGAAIDAFPTVVDNVSGDSVLVRSSYSGESEYLVLGAAHSAGVNNAEWHTDLCIYNPTDSQITAEMAYVVNDDPENTHEIALLTLDPGETEQYLDIVGEILGGDETVGYLVISGKEGDAAPQIAARTYDRDPSGGTYGLNLGAFGSADLLFPGESGFVVGVSNSANRSIGFRTNLGILNTDDEIWTRIRITLFNASGTIAAEPREWAIRPGVMQQFNVFKKLGLSDVTMTGTIQIEVLSGGGLAAFATEIDNRTQDSIFIRAQRAFNEEGN